jgi:hypothetical protein
MHVKASGERFTKITLSFRKSEVGRRGGVCRNNEIEVI